MTHKSNDLKILLFDIETAPIQGYTWGTYETDVIEISKDWYMLSFAAKWLGSKSTDVYTLKDFPGYKKDPTNDYKLVELLRQYLTEADLIVAHNGDSFDIKKTYARLAVHGMEPPAPTKTIDTLKMARKYFNFSSNKLDDLGYTLGLGRKLKHEGKHLWLGCMSGDTKSWKKMAAYNKRDVELLEKVYLRLRPFMSNHPNMRVLDGRPGCPNCGEDTLQRRGYLITTKNKFQRYQCQDCGSWCKGEKIPNSKEASK